MTSLGIDINVDLELRLHSPQRSYDSPDRTQISHAYGTGDTSTSAVSPSTAIPLAALDQDATIRNGRISHDEDSADVSEAQERLS